MKVHVACTGLNQSTRQKVLALHEAGMLSAFSTTLVVHGGDRLLGRIPALASRRIADIPPALIHRWPWFELLRLLSSRLDGTGILTDRIWELADRRFSRRAARDVRDASAVLGFEHSSLELFEAAKAQGLRCIYDVPSAHSALIRSLLEPIFQQHPSLRTPYRIHTGRIEARRQARRDREFELADLVVAHSTFSRESYIKAGFPPGKIISVPYGTRPAAEAGGPPPADPVPARRDRRPVFLFAGNFALHKGVLTLWEAWRLLDRPDARLLVAGTVLLPEEVMRTGPPGIEYLGRLSWPDLQRLYQDCTALVFPTLSDGFGLVITEAMAHGLPVITTRNAGASDLVRDGRNGLIVPILDPSALAAAMRSLCEDPGLVDRMREVARKSVEGWQWADFRLAFARALREGPLGA